MDWLIGLAGSMLIAGLAYWRKALTLSGSFAAVFIGTLLYGFGSLAWFGTLIVFFVSSSLLSVIKEDRKSEAETAYEKSGTRDAGQVLANGGLAALLCLGNAFWPHPLWWAAFVGVMAAVTADTWATEIGGLSRKNPRTILGGEEVTPGTSGGVTLLGFLASMLGGLFIGMTAWVLTGWGKEPFTVPQTAGEFTFAAGFHSKQIYTLLLIGLWGGLMGSVVDSVIGAKWQMMYKCQVCLRLVERREHCNLPTKPVRKWVWLNNDAVNIISSVAAGGTAILILCLL